MEQEDAHSRTTLAVSHSEDSTPTTRKQRIKLKAAQRKHKNASDGDDNDAGEGSQRQKPSRQVRMQIQKLKNRESAQRSRDQRKQYISRLELENSELRRERDELQQLNRSLSDSKLCSRCAGPLQKSTCEILEPYPDEFQSLIGSSGSPDELNYTRIVQEGVTHPSMLLFGIFMVLAVFTFQSTPDQAAAPALIMAPAVSALVDVDYISKALVPLRQNAEDSCLVEYIGNRQYGGTAPRVPRVANLRSTELVQLPNDVLLCRNPHLVRYNNSARLVSSNLEILVKGDQLNITGPLTHLDSNDLYMLLVEVKGIEKYTGYKCLA